VPPLEVNKMPSLAEGSLIDDPLIMGVQQQLKIGNKIAESL
jgi:hypothetical protein